MTWLKQSVVDFQADSPERQSAKPVSALALDTFARCHARVSDDAPLYVSIEHCGSPDKSNEAFPRSSSYGMCSISSAAYKFAEGMRVFWNGLSRGKLHISGGGLLGRVTWDCTTLPSDFAIGRYRTVACSLSMSKRRTGRDE